MLLALLFAADLADHRAMGGDVPAWYTALPQVIPGRPGTLIRAQPMTGELPPRATAWKLLYRSTGLQGEPVAVSAMLVVPGGPVPSAGRPIVAWAHPTSGIERSCAPSLLPDGLQTIMGLRPLLEHGIAVVATDYPGLGTPGPHPYLVGISEGRAVLDAVRATRNFVRAHAGSRFAVWGHSQGGHAALHAAMLAPTYAPELRLVGVAAAAPATDLRALTSGTGGDPMLQAMLISAWSQVYAAPVDSLVERGEQPRMMQLAQACIGVARDAEAQPAQPPAPNVSYRTHGILADTEPWASIAMRNSTGVLPAGVPVLLATGGDDRLIPQEIIARTLQQLCGAGARVHRLVIPGVDHRFVGRAAAGPAADWIIARFAGRPAPDYCR